MKNSVFVKKTQKSIKIIAVLLLLCLLFTALSGCSKIPSSYEKDKVILSEMSEKDCIRFIESKGVVIPEEFKVKPELGSLIKELILRLEENPNYPASSSYTVLHEFSQNIKRAVNGYYGITG